jgi:isoquinoline 1-oxidoreductase subunit beta
MSCGAVDLGRRKALKLGGFSLAFVWLGAGKAQAFMNAQPQPGDRAMALADGHPTFAPNAFIRIDTAGPVRLVMPQVEMGQGIYTGACALLAEELDIGMDQIKIEHAPPSDELYGVADLGGQATGGSTSTRAQWGVLREAAAIARTMLVTAAANRWHVDPAECTVRRGVVSHDKSGRKLSFGALATAAAALPIPAKATLKDPAAFSLIGKPLRRIDSADKVTGATQFGIDARVPGMKIATVRGCPTFGGKLKSVQDERARQVPGFVQVLKLDNAVAVVGEHFWAAKQGLDALDIEWDPGVNAHLTTAHIKEGLAQASVTGLPESKIVVNNHYIGGGFGRRLEADSVEQAVAFAKQVSYPLKVIWTREQDIQHDIPRPMYYDRISAVLGSDGRPVWYEDHITGASVLARWAPPAMGKDGLDDDLVECAAETPYDIASMHVDWARYDMPVGLDIGWWRGVGPTHNLFVVESFMDELAHATATDPVEYRRALLGNNPRSRALLDLAAGKIGWRSGSLPARVGRGVAMGEPFGSRVCVIVEAEVSPQGAVRVRRVVAALDCGIAVNPSSVEAQIQGGLIFGLSAALYSGITLKNGAIEQSNFHDYRILRINEAPLVEVYRIENNEPPGGLGEVGTAIAAPALANAIFAATGVRLRELPIDPKLLIQDSGALRSALAARHTVRAETRLT